MQIEMKNKAFAGVDGYEHKSFENICTLIAKGIIEPEKVVKVEEILSLGFTYIIGQYELRSI